MGASSNTSMPGMSQWVKKGYSAADAGQPQDLSIHSKSKDSDVSLQVGPLC